MKKKIHVPGPFADLLIAPCGIDCAACGAFLRPKNPCFGCLPEYPDKGRHATECRIKACAAGKGFLRCSECPSLPCALMKHIDARYRKSWGEPLVEDLRRLSSIGMEAYLSAERIRWTCPVCGARRSIHSRECSSCQTPDSRFSKAENNENERSQ